jgi:hypothetical protein
MKFDANKYNVLEINECLIGETQSIILTMKNYVKDLIENMDTDSSDENSNTISEILELINDLYQDVITDKIYFNSLIKVYYSGMGQYRYHILEEKEIY